MKMRFAGVLAVAAVLGLAATLPTAAAENSGTTTPTEFPLKKPPLLKWSFAGPFGTFDTAQLQRGYQVYKEVCSACHSLNLVAFHDLEGLEYNEAERTRERSSHGRKTRTPIDENSAMTPSSLFGIARRIA